MLAMVGICWLVCQNNFTPMRYNDAKAQERLRQYTEKRDALNARGTNNFSHAKSFDDVWAQFKTQVQHAFGKIN